MLKQYCQDLTAYRILSIEEEKHFAILAHKGNTQAQHRLVTSNLPMVVSIAKEFLRQGIDYEDLIQEGNLALIKASRKTNPTKGRFVTYAGRAVRYALIDLVNKARRRQRLEKVGESLGEELPRSPNNEDRDKAYLRNRLQVLSQRERQILELRYGLHDGIPRQTRDVGNILGISRRATMLLLREARQHLREAL